MPTYLNPKRVTVDPGGGFPVGAVIVLGVIGYAAYQAAEWIASVMIAIEFALAVVAVGSATVLVLVLRRQRGRVIKPGTVPLPRPAQAAPATQVRELHHHEHLHLHGVTGDDIAALVSRQSAAVRPEIEKR